jgi:hypothetical protein
MFSILHYYVARNAMKQIAHEQLGYAAQSAQPGTGHTSPSTSLKERVLHIRFRNHTGTEAQTQIKRPASGTFEAV